MRKSYIASFSALILLSLVLTIPSVFADTWYIGKGLNQGDFFRYSVCNSLMGCKIPLEFDFWIKNQTTDGNWNLQFVAIDGNSTQRGTMTINQESHPVSYSHNLIDYAPMFEDTIGWVNHLSNKTQPKDFANPAWTRYGLQGFDTDNFSGSVVGPINQENVTVQAGSFNAWIISWQKDPNSQIWVVPNLPYPIKGEWHNPYLGIWGPRLVFNYELLEVGNSMIPPKFVILSEKDESSDNFTLNKHSSDSSITIKAKSPLKQFKSGIETINMQCKEGFVLMIKNENGYPACVSQETESKLFARGWGVLNEQTSWFAFKLTARSHDNCKIIPWVGELVRSNDTSIMLESVNNATIIEKYFKNHNIVLLQMKATEYSVADPMSMCGIDTFYILVPQNDVPKITEFGFQPTDEKNVQGSEISLPNMANTEKKIWFEFTPIECQSTPWANSFRNFSGVFTESFMIKKYFNDQGITILESLWTYFANEHPVPSCGYPSDYAYYLRVSESDENKMSRLGYKTIDTIPNNAHPIPN